MNVQTIKLSHFANVKRWKKIGKDGSETQVMFRLGHFNPEYNIDPVYGQANKVLKQEQRGNTIETTSTTGISTKKGRLSDFYEVLTQFAKMGALKGFTVEKIQEHRDKMNEAMPEECDFWTDISIADYKEEKVASQSLENLVDQFTKGFANISVPGASNNMTLEDAFKNPMVRAEAKKQGFDDAKMEEALKKIKEASQQTVDQVKKLNIKYQLGKFNNYPAVYCVPPILTQKKPSFKKKNETIKIKNPDGSLKRKKLGGGSDPRLKLPENAFEKEDYPIGGKLLQAIKIKSYLITGNMLTSLYCMPSEKLFCQSLIKFKKITQTTRQGNLTFIDHFIVPINSNLGKEGYLNREEAENMLLKLLAILENR